MNCDRCQKPTNATKEITSKKTGKEYTVYICQAGCMNGQYPYTFFPPKASNGGNSQISAEILKTLQDIRSLMAVQKGIRVGQVTNTFPNEFPNVSKEQIPDEFI